MAGYVKNEKGYAKSKFDTKAIKETYSKRKTAKKGIPYQMRMLIVKGLEKLKKAAWGFFANRSPLF